MKILQVCPKYYPSIGGVEYVVKSIAERLVRQGHEVIVFTGESNIHEPHEDNLNDVHIVRWPTWSPSNAYHIPKMRRKLESVLKRTFTDVDVIHIHNIHAVTAYYAWKAWKESRREWAKLVITPYYHGGGHTLLRKAFWFMWGFYVRKMLMDADVVHTVSKSEAQLVKKDFNVDAIPIENGVEEFVHDAKWQPKDYVLCASRIERYKNIDKLARVVSLLNKEHGFRLKFLVIGSGPYKRELERTLKNIGIEYQIMPFQPFENYVELMSQAQLFGLLSQKESYPQSVNEANAIGVPVIVARPWGENFAGRRRTLIVELTDVEIAQKIKDFLKTVPTESVSDIPTWSAVTEVYIDRLYNLKG